MTKEPNKIIDFLNDLMRRRRLLPSQLAAALHISHATISRWLSGEDVPSVKSCQKLAEYSGSSINEILSTIGCLPMTVQEPHQWPEFREYAQHKYPNELDEDLIIMIEDLIERRRAKNSGKHIP